jgi:membrane protease YdiL (CAAX protease family)
LNEPRDFPTLPYNTPPAPAPRSGRPGAAVAWLLILVSVAYMAAGRALFDPAKRVNLGDDAPRPFQLLFAGRYAVGITALPPPFGRGGGTAPTTASTTRPASPAAALLAQLDAAAKTDADRLRAAVVAGEVSGAEAALSRIGQGRRAFDSPTFHDASALETLYTRGPGALTADQADGLVRRHGWFGQLALTFGKPPDDARRREVIRPAVRTVYVAVGAGVGGLVALALGLALLILGIVLWSTGRLKFAYVPPDADRPTEPFLEAFAAYLFGIVVLSLVAALLARGALGATWFMVAIIPAAFFWPLLRRVRWAELRYGLGWTAGRGWPREIGAGILGYLAGLPLLAAGALVTLVLQKLSGADTTHPIVNEITRSGAWRIFRLFLLAAVWAPVVEETMFRGAFYHHLRRKLPWPAAAALVAVLFAAIHPQGWAAIPVLGAIGFSFAAMREWRGAIVAPAVAHAINNGVMTVLLVLMMG